MSATREVVLGLGANLGSRVATLRAAVDLLTAGPDAPELVATSSFYETEPVGPPQPRYVNAAVRVRARESLEALHARTLSVERALGRVRTDERWGPRLVDIDLLWAFGEIRETDALTVPHPRLTERAFAIVPLLSVAPEAASALPAIDGARLTPMPPPEVTVSRDRGGAEVAVRATASDADDALAHALAGLVPSPAPAGPLEVVEPEVRGAGPWAMIEALGSAVADGWVVRRAVVDPTHRSPLRLVGRRGRPGMALVPTEARVEGSNGRVVACLSARIDLSPDVAK